MSDKTRCYLIDTGYAAGGVVVRGGVVVQAAPVFRWMVTRPWEEVRVWPKIKSIQETGAPKRGDAYEPGTRAYQERVERDGQMRLELFQGTEDRG